MLQNTQPFPLFSYPGYDFLRRCRHFRFVILMHAIIERMRRICYELKSKMAGDGDREMVLANFQVNRCFCCIQRVFFWVRILFLISNQSITGIENLEECITLLEHHNWDLTVGSDFAYEGYFFIAFDSFSDLPIALTIVFSRLV